MTCSAGKRVNHHVQTNGKWAKVKPMPSKTTNRVWVHWCPSFGLCPDYIFPIFFNDSKLFLVINKLNQLKHNFCWTIIIYCTIRYILILNTSPFDMGKKMVHVKLGITISQPLFSADVPLCFWHSLLLISHKIPSCSLICHHIPWYPVNLSHTIPILFPNIPLYRHEISMLWASSFSVSFSRGHRITQLSSLPTSSNWESCGTRDFSKEKT